MHDVTILTQNEVISIYNATTSTSHSILVAVAALMALFSIATKVLVLNETKLIPFV